MGVVHLARQRDLDRLVALKALHSVHVNAAAFAERFLRESRVAGSLSHPNIVTVYEYFEYEQTPYIAMEYVSRGSLRTWGGSLSLAQLAGVLEGLLAGLSAVEPSGTVHRDLKPENVMVTADGRVKITDFGIAKATEATGEANITSATTGATMGTPAYMAPEQALSEAVGPWTDLYSVGIMAYEQLVGRVPFHDSRAPMAVMLRHINEPIPPAVHSKPDLDPGLSDWVGKLLVKDPGRRTQHAGEAWEDLEEIIIGLLGARWRRDARLLPRGSHEGAHEPLTPAPFEAHGVGVLSPSAPPDGWTNTVPSTTPSDGHPTTAMRARRLAAVSAAALAAVGLGFAVAPGQQSGQAAKPLTPTISNHTIGVSYPESWRPTATPASTPRLSLTESLGLAPIRAGGALVVGSTQTASATLLPSRVLSALPSAPRGEIVRLGGLDFYRYRGLEFAGGVGAETLYAHATTAGVVIGACELPSRSAEAINVTCERILATLRLINARSLPLGPNPSYAKSLRTTIARLNSSSDTLRTKLARADSPGSQTALADELAGANERAGKAMRSAVPGPAERAASAAIVGALSDTARGYVTMAAGAKSGSSRLFERGRQTVAAGTTALAAALRRLAPLGYKITS